MDDQQGASSSYISRFAITPDGLPPFYNPDEDSSYQGVSDASEERRYPAPIFENEDREKKRVLEQLEGESYYALMNLPKTATAGEIKDRYRVLAVAFHPDKHRANPALSSSSQNTSTDGPAAEHQFARIQHAYSILSDPHKRAVYDMLGEQGLREIGDNEEGQEGSNGRTGWKVIRRLGSPDEIKRHYQRVVYEKRLASIEAMVKTKGDLSVNVDARACFLPEAFFADPTVVKHDAWSRAKRVRAGGMSLKHSFHTPISSRTSLMWQGQMMSRNGAGGGNVVGTVRHAFGPKLWIEAGTSLLNPRVGTGKLTYAHDQDTFATFNAVQQTTKAPPTLALTVGRKVLPRTTGFVTLRSGFWTAGPWGKGVAQSLNRTDRAALSVGLTNMGHTGNGWTVETTGGVTDRHVSLDYTMNVLSGFKVKVGAAFGSLGGLNGFVNTERQVTDNTKLGLGVTAAIPGGITLRIRIWRLGQKIVIPIMLSQDLNPVVAFVSTVLPATSIVALHYLYIEPRRLGKLNNKIEALQKENAEYLEQKRAEAMDATALMQGYVAGKVEQERASETGLLVISAHYGPKTAFTATGMREIRGQEHRMIDVTVPVQALVTNGKLLIPGGRGKFGLLGFYDTCMGEEKSLRVQYLFRDQLHEVTVADAATLRAPMRLHAIADARNGTWEA